MMPLPCVFYSLRSIGQNPVLTKPALITAMTYAKRETSDRDSRNGYIAMLDRNESRCATSLSQDDKKPAQTTGLSEQF